MKINVSRKISTMDGSHETPDFNYSLSWDFEDDKLKVVRISATRKESNSEEVINSTAEVANLYSGEYKTECSVVAGEDFALHSSVMAGLVAEIRKQYETKR